MSAAEGNMVNLGFEPILTSKLLSKMISILAGKLHWKNEVSTLAATRAHRLTQSVADRGYAYFAAFIQHEGH